ncbi:MAG: GNAT family N-acetyltransferase [Lachnospiraceae bacterium]|nr:GNAT family N-acetyltransferase [Lachnospiraceae bacterium]
MNLVQELFEIFKRNFPFVVRDRETALEILNHEGNTTLEERDEQDALIGAAVVNRSTILMLCVDEKHRRRGIGSRLLARAEEAIRAGGFEQINVGNGFNYLAPGVPTAKRYFEAENEKLYPGLDETASDFFTKRGYVHSWECNCFDMRFPLSEFEKSRVGKNIDSKQPGFEGNKDGFGYCIDGITYRLATLSDRDAVCACTDDAYQEFTEYYRADAPYCEGNGTRVLIAVSEGEVVGTLFIGVEDEKESLGSVGCTTVRPSWRGRHIAVNLVAIGTKYLKDIGLREAYLSYTYTGLDHMYGYAGYKICVYFMMAVKNIGG